MHGSSTRRGTHKAILHHGYGTYPISIKLIFRYPETKLRMQSLFPSNLLGFRDMWGETSIHIYYTTNVICTKQQSNLFTSILGLDLWCKACPPWMCGALDICKEGHQFKHITHYTYNIYQTTIKRVYKYLETRLMMQSLSPLDVLGLRARQERAYIQIYHTTNIICTKQKSNWFTSILRLN